MTRQPPVDLAPCVSIDGTDIEAWARNRSWAKNKKNIQLDGDRQLPDVEVAPKGAVSEPGWPRTAPDGKPRNTLDPNARAGHRSGKNNRPGDIYDGYEAHFATQIPAVPRKGSAKPEPVPHLVLGMHLISASSHRGPSGVALIDGNLYSEALPPGLRKLPGFP
ncbi:MAG: hypothetical protein ACRDQ7_24730 [Haloechinothrix sp.]